MTKQGRPVTVNTKPVARFDRMSVKRKTENPELWVAYSTNSNDPIYIFDSNESRDNVRSSYRRKVGSETITTVRACRMRNFIDIEQ
jgi:hypothetical protein